jgi:hypothetical protein
MKHNTTKHPRGWRRRMMGALGALVIAGSALAMTASTAAAEDEHGPACNYPTGSNTCLWIAPVQGNLGSYAVRVGIDIEKSKTVGDAILAAASAKGEPAFRAEIVGDDGNCETSTVIIKSVDVPFDDNGPQAEDNVLSAGFLIKSVPASRLNEDPNDRDELCARVTLYDYRFGLERKDTFTSGKIVGDYSK